MKLGKFIIIIVLALLSNKAIANAVDSTRALNYAVEFFKAKSSQSGNARVSSFEIEIVKKQPYIPAVNTSNARINSSQEEFLYYIFNVKNNGGFIIISGDDAAEPVLAYSLEGSFDQTLQNPGAKIYLTWYQKQLETIKNLKLLPNSDIQEKWNMSSLKTQNLRVNQTTNSKLIPFSTKWDQGQYYNKFCPTDYQGKTVTGCVATAMAQVMKYHEYPLSASFAGQYSIINATDGVNTNFVSVNNENYSWANMPNSLNSISTTQQIDAISKLIYHCGLSVRMQYATASKGGSGAYTEEVATALINTFKYDSNLEIIKQNNNFWSNTEIAKIKTTLDGNMPIIFAGSYDENGDNDTDGGHCFVIHGYDSDGKFIINWGWSGYQDDGAWTITNLNPLSGGIGSGNGTFNLSQMAILNIRKPTLNCDRFYTKKKATVTPNLWYTEFAESMTRLGLVSQNTDNTFNSTKKITLKEAVRSICLAANTIKLPEYQNFSNLTCNLNDPGIAFLNLLKDKGVINQLQADNANVNIEFGQLCKIINTVIFGSNFPKDYRTSNYTKATISSTAKEKESIQAVINIKGIIKDKNGRNKVDFTGAGFKDAIINGNETVTNAMLSKFLFNALTFKFERNKTAITAPSSSMAAFEIGSKKPTDYTVIGDKFEIEGPISGTEIPSVTSPTLTLNGGEVRTFSSVSLTHDGLPLHFYWTADGGTIEKMTDNFSKIKFTAPFVTSQKKIQLYFYTASAGGYAIEAFRTIIVNPINVNFSITSTATTICSGESLTLTASGCNGTLHWNENLGNQAILTIAPTSSKTYYADCLYSGTSKRSNSISVSVKSAPTTSPFISNGYSTVYSGDRVTLIASGCPSGTTYYWKDFLASDRVTFYPTESDSYTAFCVKDGCNSLGTTTEVNVINTNCDIGEVNNTPETAHTLFEFKDKLYGGSEYFGEGRFCIKNPTDNMDWYKIKIHEKWYYLKISINGNNCPECIYKLRFQVDGGKLLVMSYLFTPGKTANVQVYDTNQTTLLGSQNFNNSTEHELEINICGSLPKPEIDFNNTSLAFLKRCTPSDFVLHVTHPIYQNEVANGGTNMYFSWSDEMDGSNQVNEGTYYYTEVLSAQKTYYVRSSTSETNTCIGEDYVSITVYPNLSPNTPIPTVTVSKTSVSLGETITLNAIGCPSIVKWNSLPILVDDKISGEVKYGDEIFHTPVLRSFDSQITNTYYARCITETCVGTGGGSPRVTVYRINKPIISSTKTNICPNETITLTASGCSGGTITWNNNLGTGSSKTVNPTLTTTYSATCTLNGATTDYADGFTVFVNNFVGGTITPATQTICQDPSVSVSRLLNQKFVLSNYSGNVLRWEYKTPSSGWNDWGQTGVDSPSDCCFGWQTGTWKVRAIIGNGVCPSIY